MLQRRLEMETVKMIWDWYCFNKIKTLFALKNDFQHDKHYDEIGLDIIIKVWLNMAK